jgi:hypothetical protein
MAGLCIAASTRWTTSCPSQPRGTKRATRIATKATSRKNNIQETNTQEHTPPPPPPRIFPRRRALASFAALTAAAATATSTAAGELDIDSFNKQLMRQVDSFGRRQRAHFSGAELEQLGEGAVQVGNTS